MLPAVHYSSFKPQKSVFNAEPTQTHADQYQPLFFSSNLPSSVNAGPSPIKPSLNLPFLPKNVEMIGIDRMTFSTNVGCGGRASEIGRRTTRFTVGMWVM